MLGNKMLANDQAASVTTYLSENKTIFSQKLGRVQTPLQLRRELKNKNKEVTVRMIAKRADILEIAKQAIRDQLEKDGKQLSDELKAYFGN
jgi:PP-loop superfamily ATP-utilizing enzyme